MPIIILLGIFGFTGAVDLFNTCSTKAGVHDKNELDNMLGQMVGKSKAEARKIARMHRR